MKVPSCGCLECLWKREHPNWVAFWCICGPVKRTLGLDFSVRAKRAACTCQFPMLFPSKKCLASDSMGNNRQSFLSRPATLNDESVGSNRVNIPQIVRSDPLVIGLSDNEDSPQPTWVKALQAQDVDFVEFLRDVICSNPTYVNLSSIFTLGFVGDEGTEVEDIEVV